MESYYEVNVAEINKEERYSHKFKVRLPTWFEGVAQREAREIAQKYPAPQYKVELTYWECLGHEIEI